MIYYIEPQYSEHFDITYFLTFPNRVRYIEVLLCIQIAASLISSEVPDIRIFVCNTLLIGSNCGFNS